MTKTTVIVIDDSALIRKMLTEILNADPEIEVVATAADPYQAREKIKQHNPDVITLDVEMPKMDGITFLRNLMRLRPMPVVMVSTLTEQGAQVTLDALELGALEIVAKPKIDVSHTLADYAEELTSKVKSAARVTVRPLSERAGAQTKHDPDAVIEKKPTTTLKTTEKIIAIGASTGGTEALREVITALPADMPAIVVTQHIPAAFSGPFAERLNGQSQMQVAQAKDGQQILPGHVYVAPGDQHLMVTRSGARYFCKLDNGPLVSRHKPSVDVLFRSVAQFVGPNAIGVMLTGMGDDGTQGMLEMRDSGAFNIAQDEQSSVVWGMPGSAFEAGAVEKVLPLNQLAPKLRTLR